MTPTEVTDPPRLAAFDPTLAERALLQERVSFAFFRLGIWSIKPLARKTTLIGDLTLASALVRASIRCHQPKELCVSL